MRLLRTARDWVFTVPFLVAFAGTLVVFDPVGRLARLFGIRPFEVVMGVMQRVLIWDFRICGVRYTIDRPPEVRRGKGYVFVSNHQSLVDIPFFGGILFRNYPKYVAKQELGRGIPSVSLNLRHGQNALIDRRDRRQSIGAIRELGETAQRRNVSVVIFPEGTRARDGQLQEFKRAGSVALLKAAPELEVVPTAIDGTWVLSKNKFFPIPFGTRVRVRFGGPMGRDRPEGELVAAAESWIAETLAEWRKPASV